MVPARESRKGFYTTSSYRLFLLDLYGPHKFQREAQKSLGPRPLVLRFCKSEGIPVLFVLAGGYQTPIEEKLLPLHLNTFSAAYEEYCNPTVERTFMTHDVVAESPEM